MLDRVKLSQIKRIASEGGDVLHAIKKSDSGFEGFGEAYFSFVESGAVKGWKLHREMTLNLTVPLGMVRFVLFDNGDYLERCLGDSDLWRLTVPPRIWFAFQGLSTQTSIVLNVANIEHDPSEGEKKGLNEIEYDWNS